MTVVVAIGVLVLSFVMKWEQANKVLAAVSALAGVVSICVAVWLAPDRTAHPASRGTGEGAARPLGDIDVIGRGSALTTARLA
ncbi:hypothetical protein [Actinomadura sp. 6N118]|uniref:hypothetical protein n=1 Tax=Actinomadura sp. 6N118 TaxID=3375151 RepID=UPI003790DECC